MTSTVTAPNFIESLVGAHEDRIGRFSDHPMSHSVSNVHAGRDVGGIHIDMQIGETIFALLRSGYSPRWSCQGGSHDQRGRTRWSGSSDKGYLVLNDSRCHGDIYHQVASHMTDNGVRVHESHDVDALLRLTNNLSRRQRRELSVFLAPSIQPGADQPVLKAGKIPGAVKVNGGIFVPVEGDTPAGSGPDRAVTYARVSSSQNKDNLAAQSERVQQYAAARGYTVVQAVTEVGSGLNDQRKKLHALWDSEWDVLVVEHKDRLTRFGFAYLEHFAPSQNRRIEVINHTEDNDDLTEDLVSIVTSFCARIYGRHRSQRKTEKIIAELGDADGA